MRNVLESQTFVNEENSYKPRPHTLINERKPQVHPPTTSRPAFLFKIRFWRCCYFRHGRRVEGVQIRHGRHEGFSEGKAEAGGSVQAYVHLRNVLDNENESDWLKWVCRVGNCSSAWTRQNGEEVVLLACSRDPSASLRDCQARRREPEAIRRDRCDGLLNAAA